MPLLWLSLAFLIGIWAASLLNWSSLVWVGLSGAALFLLAAQSFVARRFPNLPPLKVHFPNPDGFPASHIPFFLIVFSLSFGGLRYQMVQPVWDGQFVASYNELESEFTIQGVVVRPPDVRDRYTLLTIRTEAIRAAAEITAQPTSGLLLARIPVGGDWRYGDRITVQGILETPPEDEQFSYRQYLERQGIYSYLPNARASLAARDQGNRLLAWLYAFRERALRSLYQSFPDPEASLLAGILLGVDAGIPAAVVKAFQDSATSHIIAISGFNVAIVSGMFAALFGRLLGRRRGALAAMISIALYTLLVGASASVVRAAIMAGLAVFAAQIGRRGNGLNTLAIVAALMALFDPNILWDVGFQLSFMATLGLVLYAGALMDGFARLAGRWVSNERARRLAQPVGEYFLFTLAVLLPTLPIMAYHFQRLPLAGLLANPLILPAQPAVMVLGGLAMLLGMLYQPLGQAAAYLAWPFVAYTIRMAEFWAQFKGTILHFGKISAPAMMIFYALLVLLTFGLPAWWARARAAQSAGASAAPSGEQGQVISRAAAFKAWLSRSAVPLSSFALAGLAILTVLVWRSAWAAPDGRLHMTLLDVGSGDGILIQTPGGRNVLIDGGSSPSALSDALGRRLPLTQRSLDYLIVAGAEDEQLGALPTTLERFPAARALWAGPTGATRSARLLSAYLVEAKVPVTPAQTGQTLDLGDGARLRVVSANQRGAALMVEWGNFRLLLPVGLDRSALEDLQADPALAPVNALLLSDGGYAPLNPPALIEKLHPGLILLSVAAGDARNLPDAEVMDAVDGYTLLRTDQNGWIELSTDGEQLWVEAAR